MSHDSWSVQQSGTLASSHPPWRGPSHSLTAATSWPSPSPLTACGSRITAKHPGCRPDSKGTRIEHHAVMGRMQVITSSLSLARELWRRGEPGLADAALQLSPDQVADVGSRAGEFYSSGEADWLWPGGPPPKALLLAATEQLEGSARPCARTRRLPERGLQAHLQAAEEERRAAAEEVARHGPPQRRIREMRGHLVRPCILASPSP